MKLMELIQQNDPRMLAGLKALRDAGYKARAQEKVPGKRDNSTRFSYYIDGEVMADELHKVLDKIFPDGFVLSGGQKIDGKVHQIVKFVIPRRSV